MWRSRAVSRWLVAHDPCPPWVFVAVGHEPVNETSARTPLDPVGSPYFLASPHLLLPSGQNIANSWHRHRNILSAAHPSLAGNFVPCHLKQFDFVRLIWKINELHARRIFFFNQKANDQWKVSLRSEIESHVEKILFKASFSTESCTNLLQFMHNWNSLYNNSTSKD